MLEKWQLVVLIVAGTSLIFLVCFPIDFYLYRRRKRRLRERLIVHDTDFYQSSHTEIYADTEPVTHKTTANKAPRDGAGRRESTFVQIMKCYGLGKDEKNIVQPSNLKFEGKASNQNTFSTKANKASTNGTDDITSSADTDTSTVDTTPDNTEQQPGCTDGPSRISEIISQMGSPYSDFAVRENEKSWGPHNQDVANGQSNILDGSHRIDESLKQEGILFVIVNEGPLKRDADLSSLCSKKCLISEKSCNLNTDNDGKNFKEKYVKDSNMITVKSGYMTDRLKENTHNIPSGNLLLGESSCENDNSEEGSQETVPSPMPKGTEHGIDMDQENTKRTISSKQRTTFLDRCRSTRSTAAIWPRAWPPVEAVDEFADGVSTASLKVASGSFDEESVISTRRKKKIKKDGQKVSTRSTSSSKKKKFMTKQDYYTNSQADPAPNIKAIFSRY